MEKAEFEPRVVAFCCHFCAYAAADLAGTMRIQYPPNVRIIRTPCTGRLETEFFLKALETGADGVLVAGCLEGGCHYTSGNLYAKRRVEYIREMLAEIGLEKDRLRMVNVSAAGGRLLADHVTDMVETVRKLGPNPAARSSQKTAGAGPRAGSKESGQPQGAAPTNPPATARILKFKKVEKTS
jgi:F420-non-reducing hydrogenase iron-sulfur subunit